MPGLPAQNWGSPCKRLPSQTPPRTRPQPPSLPSPERSRRRLCSCCSAHEILMRERLADGGAPPPALASALLPPPSASRPCAPHSPASRGPGWGGRVRPGVGGAHKEASPRRAQPPATRAAALPWQRLPGWTPPPGALGWRGAGREQPPPGPRLPGRRDPPRCAPLSEPGWMGTS